MKILPESLPEGTSTDEELREEVEDSVVVHALLADLQALNGKNVFVTFTNKRTAVGHLEMSPDGKFGTIGSSQEMFSPEMVASVREV